MVTEVLLSASIWLAAAAEGESQLVETLLEFGTGIFALILFGVSLYAWLRRKNPSILLVAVAFLLFFFKQVAELLPYLGDVGSEIVSSILDFGILALFFVALVLIRPGRRKWPMTKKEPLKPPSSESR